MKQQNVMISEFIKANYIFSLEIQGSKTEELK
jgi:hypothetical protein